MNKSGMSTVWKLGHTQHIMQRFTAHHAKAIYYLKRMLQMASDIFH